ncbi:CBS domain-containing protein [Candidatus Beckwithbacteria bacterium]|nr:CBS domain-containing protein [Candidatus Beckwithbacteria bacterium]
MNPKTTATVKNLLKTKNIIRFDCNQTLGQVLPKLTSSHDAAFVFDGDKFIGVVSPSHFINARSVKMETKLKRIAKMPPKLKLDTPIQEVAHLMLTSNIHYLPVLDEKNNFLGITTIRRLFQFCLKYKFFGNNGTILFSNDKLHTASKDMPLSQVLALMKEKKISKIPVVDENQKLAGIVAQYDLKEVIKEIDNTGKANRKGERTAKLTQPIKDFMKKMVFTVNYIPSFTQACQIMLEKNIGSLVIVDEQNYPIDIVSKGDLLKTVAEKR